MNIIIADEQLQAAISPNESECDSEPEPTEEIKNTHQQSTKIVPRKLCLHCGQQGHLKKNCSLQHFSDEDRVRIDEIVRVQLAEIKEAKRIRRAELRQTPENKKKHVNMSNRKVVKRRSSLEDQVMNIK